MLNWDTGKLEDCTEDTAPSDRRRQPRAVRGLRRLGRRQQRAANDKVKDAAYAFFSYMTQPAQSNIDVTIGRTTPTPILSQRRLSDLWKNAGMREDEAKVYLDAIKASIRART